MEENSARVVGTLAAATLEILCFHPLDTVAKRLMNSTRKGMPLSKIFFAENSSSSMLKKFSSLYPGLGAAALYKATQRVYKFAGQPILKDIVYKKIKKPESRLGLATFDGTVGAVLGAAEIIFLPLDVIKVKYQTCSDFRKHGLSSFDIRNSFAGWRWTLIRNIPGSFSLFAGNSWCRQYFNDHNKNNFGYTCLSSIFGTTICIFISSPMDVIKTRIQSGHHGSSGWSILFQLIKQEGPTALFKGVVPKLLTVGPKLAFSFSVAQHLAEKLSH